MELTLYPWERMTSLKPPERQDGLTSSTLLAEHEGSLRRLFEAVYSEGDLGVAEEMVGDTLRAHCAGSDTSYRGVSGLKAHAARVRATFPELKVEVEEVNRTPDGFVAKLTLTGRFERPFGGVQPSCRLKAAGEEPGGPRVSFTGVLVGEVTNGRFSELAFNWDFEALRAQS